MFTSIRAQIATVQMFLDGMITAEELCVATELNSYLFNSVPTL